MRRIAVIGLGYVGLPVAVSLARRFPGTVGYDRDPERIERLVRGEVRGAAVGPEALRGSGLELTADPDTLAGADFHIVCVPTPIDRERRPDLSSLTEAARTLGRRLSPGDVVVLESTVYPGVTEELVGPILAAESGLVSGRDFKLGYSPERINPGDPEHGFEQVRKVIAAQDEETLGLLEEVYGSVVEAGVHRAASIQVAEAAKVIENVQRDLNIALVNELAMLFDRLGLDTRAVLDAAASKWNFHPYRPGLVGGHCIGVDPYYLTSKAEAVGFHPQVILAGRRINDGMGAFVALRVVRLLVEHGHPVRGARVGCLGLAFKADVPDLRNSRVPDIVAELRLFGVEVLVHDPLVDPAEALREYALELVPREALERLDAILLAVPHRALVPLSVELAQAGAGILADVTGAVDPADVPRGARHWRL